MGYHPEGSKQEEFFLVIVSMLQFSKGVYVEQIVFSHKVYFKHSKLNQYSLDQQILIVKKDPVKLMSYEVV